MKRHFRNITRGLLITLFIFSLAIISISVFAQDDDSDGDGIIDDFDDCPFDADYGFGIDDFGCPFDGFEEPVDSDFDGYSDDVDACPFEGDAGFGLDGSGCPLTDNAGADSDFDGYPDDIDTCPFQGDAGFGLDGSGCPLTDGGSVDSDFDGYSDDVDACPFEGDAGFGLDGSGCPLTDGGSVDSDFDGYTDDIDACPFEGDAGLGVDSSGCPIIEGSSALSYETVCEANGITVAIINTGAANDTFVLFASDADGLVLEGVQFTLAPGESTIVVDPYVPTGGTLDVGEETGQRFTANIADCAEPGNAELTFELEAGGLSIRADVTCEAPGAIIQLTNTGEAIAAGTVGVEVATFAGESISDVLPALGNGESISLPRVDENFAVLIDGEQIASVDLALDCSDATAEATAEPEAGGLSIRADVTCEAPGAVIQLTNTGEAIAAGTVGIEVATFAGESISDVLPALGNGESISLPRVDENFAVLIDGEQIASVDLALDCGDALAEATDEPADEGVSIRADLTCEAPGAVIQLTNTGEAIAAGTVGIEVATFAGQSISDVLPALGNGESISLPRVDENFAVLIDGVQIASVDLALDCAAAAATDEPADEGVSIRADVTCEAPGAVIQLTNTGGAIAAGTVGIEVATFAGQSISDVLPALGNGESISLPRVDENFAVLIDGVQIASVDLALDCGDASAEATAEVTNEATAEPADTDYAAEAASQIPSGGRVVASLNFNGSGSVSVQVAPGEEMVVYTSSPGDMPTIEVTKDGAVVGNRAGILQFTGDASGGTYTVTATLPDGPGGLAVVSFSPQGGATTTEEPVADGNDDFLSLLNAERASRGAGPVSYNSALNLAAQRHSDDMLSRGYFSHTAPSPAPHGAEFWDRMAAAGYPPAAAAENITQRGSEQEAFQSWMDSDLHRENMLNPAYTEIGLGRAGNLWTLVLASGSGRAQTAPITNPTATVEATLPPPPVIGEDGVEAPPGETGGELVTLEAPPPPPPPVVASGTPVAVATDVPTAVVFADEPPAGALSADEPLASGLAADEPAAAPATATPAQQLNLSARAACERGLPLIVLTNRGEQIAENSGKIVLFVAQGSQIVDQREINLPLLAPGDEFPLEAGLDMVRPEERISLGVSVNDRTLFVVESTFCERNDGGLSEDLAQISARAEVICQDTTEVVKLTFSGEAAGDVERLINDGAIRIEILVGNGIASQIPPEVDRLNRTGDNTFELRGDMPRERYTVAVYNVGGAPTLNVDPQQCDRPSPTPTTQAIAAGNTASGTPATAASSPTAATGTPAASSEGPPLTPPTAVPGSPTATTGTPVAAAVSPTATATPITATATTAVTATPAAQQVNLIARIEECDRDYRFPVPRIILTNRGESISENAVTVRMSVLMGPESVADQMVPLPSLATGEEFPLPVDRLRLALDERAIILVMANNQTLVRFQLRLCEDTMSREALSNLSVRPEVICRDAAQFLRLNFSDDLSASDFRNFVELNYIQIEVSDGQRLVRLPANSFNRVTDEVYEVPLRPTVRQTVSVFIGDKSPVSAVIDPAQCNTSATQAPSATP